MFRQKAVVPRKHLDAAVEIPEPKQHGSFHRNATLSCSMLQLVELVARLITSPAENHQQSIAITTLKPTIRLAGYDYAQAGKYFVTISTFKRLNLFGKIKNGQATHSAIGAIVKTEWQAIAIRHRQVSLDLFCVMPNHIHGIIDIRKTENPIDMTPASRSFGKPVSGSISTIVGSFKAGVTASCRKLKLVSEHPLWRPRFHDRVIRNDIELHLIRTYIELNPTVWEYRRRASSSRPMSLDELEEILRKRHGMSGAELYRILTSRNVNRR